MTPEPAAPASRSRWQRLRIGRWFLIAVLAVLGYGAWREYTFRAAVKEAQSLGWHVTYNDPFEAIQQNWKATFQLQTWREAVPFVTISTGEQLQQHRNLLLRVNPKGLQVLNAQALPDLAPLRALTRLERLYLKDAQRLPDVGALKDFGSLKQVGLIHATSLTDVRALHHLPALETLSLTGCTSLTSLDGLENLAALKWLFLSNCTSLTNVDALKNLPAVTHISLLHCSGLSNETIAALRAALPNTNIIAPDS